MESKNIDENMQSRTIATFGIEYMKKISNLKVYIYGINGISLEACKNLLLTGIKKLIIYEDKISKEEDLSWNYFLNEKDINIKRRDESVILKLKELNDYSEVVIENDLQKALNDSNVIVFSEFKNIEEIFKINEFCRENNKGFLYAGLFGLSGFIFSDFGNHYILDENGEENQKIFISSVEQKLDEKKIEFFIHKDESEGIDNEKYVIFREIEGMEELNHLEPIKIFKKSNYQYYINYEQKLGKYIKGGIIEEVKIPEKVQYMNYKEYMENPKYLYEIDGSRKNKNCLLHCFILSLQKYFDKNQKLPEINDEYAANEIVNYSKEYFNLFKKKENKLFKKCNTFDDIFIKNLAMISQIQLGTDSSFLGGILAQEILKFTGLYRPLDQILYYNNYITIENLNKNTAEFKGLEKNRYYYENIVYGKDSIEKLKNLNIFIIGAGALGCEFMKLLALMGASTEGNSHIILTDNDSIELSNLNRQFFFRNGHIGKNKSKICCQEVKKINHKVKCISIDKLVNHDSEDIFTDDFWSSIDIVILAVDNVEARKYVDKKCTAYDIKLIEAGTQGVYASSSIIIPNMTSCYNDIEQTPKKEIPQCTLKFFPLTNVHCIEYAKQKFIDFFNYNIKDAIKCIKSKTISFEEKTKNNLEKLENIKNIFKIFKHKNFENCLNLAINEFYIYFNHNIRELLNDFPKDLTNKDGSLFWNGDKRKPEEINFDINDEMQNDFIYYYAYIIAKNLKIETKDKKYSVDYISKNKFENKNFIRESELNEQINSLIEENKKELYSLNDEQLDNIEFAEFDKDDDSNHHIDFLTSFSNLRARNYKIPYCDRNLVKFTSGNIIPAVSTTTSAICGYIISQLYILLRENFKREDLRQLNFGMSLPNFCIKLPNKPIIIKNKINNNNEVGTKVPFDFTVWDKIEIEGNITLKELKNQLSNKFGLEFDFDGLYTIDDLALFQEDNDMEKLIQDLYFAKVPFDSKNNVLLEQMGIKKKDNYKNIYVKLYGAIDDIITLLFPIIKYRYTETKYV